MEEISDHSFLLFRSSPFEISSRRRAKLARMWDRTIQGVQRYSCYLAGTDKNGKPKRPLPIEEECYQPFVCTSLEDFMHFGMHLEPARQKKIPLAFFQCTNATVQLEDPTFYVPFFTYIGLRPSQLIPYIRNLPSNRRTLASFAYFNRPLHIFFDLDWDEGDYGGYITSFTRPEDVVTIQRAFVRVFSAAFAKSFGRVPSLQDHHWESGCTSTKLSLHLHILSEAFQTRTEFDDWMKQMFVPFIQNQACEHKDADAKLLGTIVSKEDNRDYGKWKCLVDTTVTGKNHLLRLVGNQKPGKQPLRWIPSPDIQNQREPSWDELLFRGLMNYSITAPANTWFSFSSSLSTVPKAQAAPPLRGEHKLHQPTTGNYEWLKKVKIPWYEEWRLPHPEPVQTGVCGRNGLPFVRYKQGSTICPVCTTKSQSARAPVTHRSNHTYLYWDYQRQVFLLKSTDSDCSKLKAYQFPVPYELQLQLPHPELQAIYSQLVHDPIPGYEMETSGCTTVTFFSTPPSPQGIEEEKKVVELPSSAQSRKRKFEPFERTGVFASKLSQCDDFFASIAVAAVSKKLRMSEDIMVH